MSEAARAIPARVPSICSVIFEKSTDLLFSADAIKLSCVWCERLTCASDTSMPFARSTFDDFELFCRKPMPVWVNDGDVFLKRSNLTPKFLVRGIHSKNTLPSGCGKS